MSQKAYSNLDPRAQEALALNQLYKSISLEMKCRCIDKNCKTVADTVEVIERYKAILGEGDTKKKQTEQSAKDSNLNRNAPYSSPYGGRSQENRRCFLCGSEEHLMRHCPMNWRNIPLPSTATGNANVQENSRPSSQ